jgi:hypothetical protein
MMQSINNKRRRNAEGEEKGRAQPINIRWGYIVVLRGRGGVGREREPLRYISDVLRLAGLSIDYSHPS